MSSNFDFTDRAQEVLGAAITLAKEHHSAQVHPAHLASALLHEGGAPAIQGGSQQSFFGSAIQKAGGDTVSLISSCGRRTSN